MAAVIGPAFVVVCAVKGWWDYLLTFLIAWLAGGIIDFPYMSSFTDLVSSGIESWFKKFSIEFEPKYHERTDKHDSDRPTIYCYHPHGLFSIGAGLFAVNLVRRGEKVALVTSTHMRWFNPLLKLLLDLAGIILVGSSPQEVQAVMKEGTHSLILVVGGYEEAVMTQDGFERMYIKNRLGFVKYAMRYNYTLTPVYAFGENDLYKCISFAGEFRKWLVRYKIPIVLFYGDASMPLLPRRTNDGLRIVVGDPVPVIVSSQPKINELRECHEWYLEALMSLYYRRKQSDRLLEVF
jgi:2-acylglycerol O-acyltransferase 2